MRGPERNEVKIATSQPHDVDVPLAVMVDNETGSGAELVAATLRALGRAKIVGAPTAGAAVIDIYFSLPSGAQLKIPVGALHAGDGSAIDGHPIVPDVMATDGADERAIDLLEAR